MIIYITSNIYRIKYSNILIRDNPTVVVCIAMYIMNSSNEGSKTARRATDIISPDKTPPASAGIGHKKFRTQK